VAVGEYDEALRRRMGLIESLGIDATRFARQGAARKQQERETQLSSQLNQPVNIPNPTGSGGNLQSFINAIVGQESGGSYGAVNKSSGALGKYQIMPGNISSWSQQALGRSITPSQFLSSPQLQDTIAQKQLGNYYNQYGPAGAAVAWYAGEGNARKYVANPSGWNKKQGAYPSVSQYVQSILRRMGM
jgi:hypothetical protein